MDVMHLAALCRKAVGVQISILRASGMSYSQIEEELRLRPNRGMTAWRLEGNRHKPPIMFIKQMVGSLERDLTETEKPPIPQPGMNTGKAAES